MPERTILAEPIDAAAFAPFGEILEIKDSSPAFQNPGLRSWRVGYDATGTTELMVIEFDPIPMTFSRLERHHEVTQCFLPVVGRWMVMAGAEPTDGPKPRLESVRAFLVAPHQGILLGRSVWHALNRFPIGASAVYTLVTTRETQAELEAERRGGPTPRLTDVYDFGGLDLSFNIALPPDWAK